MLARIACGLLLLAAWSVPGFAQCQEAKLTASDAMQGDQFGRAVALDGTTAVVGAEQEDSVAANAGAVYVFELGPSGPQEVQKLLPPQVPVGALFGASVAISEDWIAVGAHGDRVQAKNAAGSVFLFQRQGASWVQAQKLTASDFKQDARFGWSVAMSGDHLVVGAEQDWTNGFAAGAAYVFERQGPTWVQAVKLLPNDPHWGDTFGTAVAVNGDRAVIGAPGKDLSHMDSGVAYLFERSTNGWVQTDRLTPPSATGQFAGWSLALLDEVAFLGAVGYSGTHPSQGASHVFRLEAGAWVQTQLLVAADPQVNLKLGNSMAAHGKHLLVGALGDHDLGMSAGSAYLFEDLGSSWVQVGKLLATDTHIGDLFGVRAALSSGIALVGAHGGDDACPSNGGCDSGSAYVFRTSSDVVQYCSCPSAARCGNHDDFGGCANSTGQGAVLSACGSASVLLDDLVLQGRWLPPGNFALLFTGGTFANAPFGDGRLCVHPGATGVHRFAVATSDAGGTLKYGPGIAALSQAFPGGGPMQPGDVRYFQMWYRDPAGPCGSSVNLTNALRVAFQP